MRYMWQVCTGLKKISLGIDKHYIGSEALRDCLHFWTMCTKQCLKRDETPLHVAHAEDGHRSLSISICLVGLRST